MPLKEATFWYGTILFTTGIYFWIQGGTSMTIAIVLTVIGVAMSVYAVVAEHYALPRLRLWVALLLLTWALLGYDIFEHRANLTLRVAPVLAFVIGILGLVLVSVFVHLAKPKESPIADSKVQELQQLTSEKQEIAEQLRILTLQNKATEYRSHQVREDMESELRTAKMRRAEMEDEIKRLKAAQGSPLTQRAFDAAAKIRSLLTEHGPRPTLSRAMDEENGAYIRRIIQATRPWDDLIAIDWRELQREVLQVRSDLAKKGLHDDEFDGNLTSERPSEDQLILFVEKLRSLGAKAYDLSS